MFQYAAAKSLALRLQVPLKLDITYFETDKLCTYDLKFFNIEAEIATQAEIHQYTTIPSSLFSNIFYRLKNRLNKPLDKHSFISERYYHYVDEFARATRKTYVTGLWQSEKYFDFFSPTIRQHFTLQSKVFEAQINLLKKIKNITQSVAIHIRRGDYLNFSHLSMYSENLNYHYQAINYVVAQLDQPSFFVFSDDLKWVKENLLIKDYPVYYIEDFYENTKDRDDTHSSLDLMLMSACQHHIIANSTYAWWGAWLGQHSGQIVTIPEKWFGDDFQLYGKKPDTRDLIPIGWVKI